MPKGKKFTAAEKYFIEKERRYQKQIKHLNELIAAQELEIARLKDVVNEKDNQIDSQADWIRRLLEYTEYNKEDLKAVIKADKLYNDALVSLAYAFDKGLKEGLGSCLF